MRRHEERYRHRVRHLRRLGHALADLDKQFGKGDLIATCTSEHSRNRTFGYEFAHGVSLDEYQTRTHMVVEGAVAARSVSELARSLGVDIPLTFAVEQTLYNGVTLDRALEILTDRVPSQEFYGLTD